MSGTPVTFKGYYLIGDSAYVLKTVKRNDGETITAYLARLRRDSGLRQVAAATTTFTDSGQTNTAVAYDYSSHTTIMRSHLVINREQRRLTSLIFPFEL